MNEKDLLQQLKNSAESITPPDSLRPDAIEQMLRASSAEAAEENTSGKKPASVDPAPRPAGKWFSVYRLGGLAAVFALALISIWTIQNARITAGKNFNSSDALERSAPRIAEEAQIPDPPAAIPGAKSYEAVYDALRSAFYYYDDSVLYEREMEIAGMEMAIEEEVADNVFAMEDKAMDGGDTATISSQPAARDAGGLAYSETNVQEFGVDEGDVVKTDGSYIYILKRAGQLVILSADEGQLEIAASIPFSFQETVKELYVDGDRLSVIATGYYTVLDTDTEGVYSSVSKNRTNLYTYDITDRKKPEQIGMVSQDGAYSQSRKNGGYIYLFTSYAPTIRDTYETSDIVPETSQGALAASEIYLPEHLNYSTYLVGSSVNINEPGTVIDQKAVVSVASTFYASQKNIYIANEDWAGSETHTELIKLHYDNGSITGTAAGSVKGYLNNSFSLNEYDGYLRVVTTYYDENYTDRNGLYVLDENLNPVGTIQDLAPDETIRSARFLGNIGYFVTFRQTDPLFSVDLSDPADPKILGALKVSGFSSYLHFYSDDLLLGMGYEADESTGVRTGLKLSMFDISDPANVTEVHRLILRGITWCNSLDDYKSILIDPEKNLFGFTCDSRYLLFSYDPEKGFVREFIYDFYNDLINESLSADQSGLSAGSTDGQETENPDTDTVFDMNRYFGYTDYLPDDDTTRGIYVNDTLYLVRPTATTAFDMADAYREIGRISY